MIIIIIITSFPGQIVRRLLRIFMTEEKVFDRDYSGVRQPNKVFTVVRQYYKRVTTIL